MRCIHQIDARLACCPEVWSAWYNYAEAQMLSALIYVPKEDLESIDTKLSGGFEMCKKSSQRKIESENNTTAEPSQVFCKFPVQSTRDTNGVSLCVGFNL